jgi:hypothetical protein
LNNPVTPGIYEALIDENLRWRGEELMNDIESFESDERDRPVVNIGRTSPYPRILPLRDVLRAIES